MTALSLLPAPVGEPAGCALRAFGVVRARPETVAALRQKPGPCIPSTFRSKLLRYSDEQTVVSLAAVLDAYHHFNLHPEDFVEWGVVAAPRWLGRPKAAAALNKFHREGPPTASPMIVPHLSLHAVSGTISQILGIRGQNFGVGRGPGHMAEGLLAAPALLSEGRLPGLWLVLSQWDPEPSPDVQGQVASSAVCYAAALALIPVRADFTGPRLHVVPPGDDGSSPRSHEPPGVASLADFLDRTVPAPSWFCPAGWGGGLELIGTLARPAVKESPWEARA